MNKFNWKCFFGFHDFKQNNDLRFCIKCGGTQEIYKSGASDTWQWRWLVKHTTTCGKEWENEKIEGVMEQIPITSTDTKSRQYTLVISCAGTMAECNHVMDLLMQDETENVPPIYASVLDNGVEIKGDGQPGICECDRVISMDGRFCIICGKEL